MKYNITIPGKPMGKQRPRVTKTGRAYTPKETVEYEKKVKRCFATQTGLEDTEGVLKGHVKADIKAFYPIPKSTSKKNRQAMLEGKLRPTKKPDVDNVTKIVLDSLNGLAYEDDKQIVDCWIEKWYGEDPKVEVLLQEI